jgi:hypothetical protein
MIRLRAIAAKGPATASRRAAKVPCLRIVPPSLAALALCLAVAEAVAAEDRLPPIWGYGVQSCAAFVGAADGRDQGVELQAWDYRRYQDWLTGFVTGLNLATGQDVLVGADIDGAMERILVHCRGHEKQDFFTAAMDLVRMLSGLR